jgi:mannose-6-phosphate isomerase-like protein (cupin superfamily)
VLESAGMLVRRLDEVPVQERHTLKSHILMDAGELGSRNLCITWVEVPAGAHQEAHSHEESEQAYVIVKGSGEMTVAGDTQTVGVGDMVFIPPASDHEIHNDGPEDLVYVSATSPPVSMQELYEGDLTAGAAAGYDDED